MAQGEKTLTDVQEREWTQSIGMALLGFGIVIVALLLFYLTKIWLHHSHFWWVAGRIVLGLIIFSGVALIAKAVLSAIDVRKTPTTAVTCPYCDQVNKLVQQSEEGTDEFDCEHCHRKVICENGEPIPVRTIECQFCHASHRVAVTAQRYVCDRCNRTIHLTAALDHEAALREQNPDLHYDVLLIGVDRRHENEIAFKLQNLLVVNLHEARHLMETASEKTPLVISYDISHRKAEIIQRQLQDLDATVMIRPTTFGVYASQRKS